MKNGHKPKPDCQFVANGPGAIDRACTRASHDAIIKEARAGIASTMTELAELLGVSRQRLTRNCHLLGIFDAVKTLLGS